MVIERTDNSEEAARLVLRALMGSPAEADLSALDADLTESGIFSVSAPVASPLKIDAIQPIQHAS